ncbi:ORF49 [Ictalurid herpesvirus 1]|uniref:Deoxyuridine 5'-triphosphate nucleotidohydrolase n=1 Tax=Ictalurid herpesvirus 1 (strain Auburn) TaxID=766178 RepID=DUT_ICHVA|nr:ORF49 [Ictalurid herpesvirus 1]P28893.1 RecName: Full=Deoxyuridine 5'-triphosphate nucleotidohydrolase; Short=dUTPase; AltName: Full=dUTP pyrophosphatase [Ictalurid herpesvirus 1 (strain Auburn)]AAA88152.1 ORF49 [Ictalurid herpesvirus 1]
MGEMTSGVDGHGSTKRTTSEAQKMDFNTDRGSAIPTGDDRGYQCGVIGDSVRFSVFTGYDAADVSIPKISSPGSAGFDLSVLEDREFIRGCHYRLPTGLAIAVPRGYVGIITPRSSQAKNFVSTGIIDSDFRGHIHIMVSAIADFSVKKNQRIAQLVVTPCLTQSEVVPYETLERTRRGTGGFGSSGQ